MTYFSSYIIRCRPKPRFIRIKRPHDGNKYIDEKYVLLGLGPIGSSPILVDK